VRFAETGWWCAQSNANRSPCYLANIRVIFENNSEPAAKSVKKTCGTGISLILRQFDIREEQGAPNCRNTERAFDELGGGKRTHSDQESGPTSYGLIQALRENDVNVVDYKPKGEKEERLISQIDLFEGGSVLLPKEAPWLEEFVAELLSFPGRHDDQVDALAQGLAWRREAWRGPLVQRRTTGHGG
jgi:predicted phage terminase large subunit-like protein